MESEFDSVVEFTVPTYVSNIVLAVGIMLASSTPMFAENLLNTFAIFVLSIKSLLFTVTFSGMSDVYGTLAVPIISFMTLDVLFRFPLGFSNFSEQWSFLDFFLV